MVTTLHNKHLKLFQCHECGLSVCNTGQVCQIRQILTYKKGPRTKRIKIFVMVVDP